MRKTLISAIVLVLACIAAMSFAAVEVKLTVNNPSDLKRMGEPVTTGVPFPKGAVKDVSKLAVNYKGRKLPGQFTLLCPWDDGSVRWALMDLQGGVGPQGKEELVVKDNGPAGKPRQAIKVDNGDDAVKVSTGPLEFVINKQTFNLFQSIKVNSKELVTRKGKGLVVIMPDKSEIVANTAPKTVTLEHDGPMKTIVVVKGVFPKIHMKELLYTVRITAYAGQKYLKVHTWLENKGGYGYAERKAWFNFDGMYVDLGLGLGKTITATCEGVTAKDTFKVEQLCLNQHSFGDFQYTVTSGDKPLKTDKRTDGIVALEGSNGKLTVAIRHFWQNYEKAIELSGGKLKLWLWPTSGQWPRSVKRGASCNEFGEFRKAGLYALPGGVHKGYEAILDFSGRDTATSAATLNKPLLALATPAYYASTLAAPGWFAPANFTTGQADYDAKVKIWNKWALNAVDPAGNGSLIKARRGAGERRGFWYGWMDFGDLFWQPGHNSLHYDWTWVMLTNFLRTNDRRFFDMGVEMARHRTDVDQIWSDKVNKNFRGLTRYEKGYTDVHGGKKDGYYKPITSHHWASGLVLYYMLTGEAKAKEAAVRSAMGVTWRQTDKFRKAPGAGGQPRSSGWGILVYCSVYDMTGDKKWLDEALVLWNNNLKVKADSQGPTMGGGNYVQYLYCVYPLCQLHARTGNEEVFKVLKAGADSGIWNDHPVEVNHLSNLYAYVGWKTKNDELFTKAHKAFARAIGSNANPACYTGNGAWSKETIKRLRYAHLLQYIHWAKAQGKK